LGRSTENTWADDFASVVLTGNGDWVTAVVVGSFRLTSAASAVFSLGGLSLAVVSGRSLCCLRARFRSFSLLLLLLSPVGFSCCFSFSLDLRKQAD
jgi:hypothetical protein